MSSAATNSPQMVVQRRAAFIADRSSLQKAGLMNITPVQAY